MNNQEDVARLRLQRDKLARRIGWMEGLLERLKWAHPEFMSEIERSLNSLAAHIAREFGDR